MAQTRRWVSSSGAGTAPLRWPRRSAAQRVPSKGSEPPGADRAPSRTSVSPSSHAEARRPPSHGVDQAQQADDRRRVDVGPGALVVEAHVAPDDGKGQGAAGLGHPVDALGELPHDLGVLRVAEVEAVDDRDRGGADAGQVGHALGHHQRRAHARVERARARVGVGGQCDAPRRGGQPGAGQTEQRRIAAGSGDRVEEELVVVLAVDPARRAHHGEQVAGALGRGRGHRRGRVRRARGGARPVVERSVVGEGRCGNVGQHRAVAPVADAQTAAAVTIGLRDGADHGRPDLPPVADGRDGRPRCGRDDGEHALLALARHHLPGLHPLLTPWHGRDVDVHAHAAPARRLAGGAGEAGAAEILDPDDQPGVEQLQAGFDQPLLLEGIAHLDAGALRVVGRAVVLAGEPGGREHAHATDAVTPGGRAEQNHQVARTRGDAQHESLGRQGAHAEHVHERVLGVAPVEGQLAAYGRHADRVPVARDPPDHALDQPALAGVVGRPEEQRVHHGQGPCAHGEDVAQDAAHPGGRSLRGLDGGGVVVALDPYRHRDAVAGVDHPGVLARTDQHARPLRRQAPQVQAGRLVRAVLAPHHRIEGELQVVGRAAQDLSDRLEFVVAEAERPVQGFLGPRLHGDTNDRGRATYAGRSAATTTRSRSFQTAAGTNPAARNQPSCSSNPEGWS